MNQKVKVAVFSAKDSKERNIMYRVLFDNTPISWYFFSNGIRRIVSFFEKNSKPFVFMDNKNVLESELTLAFCRLANNFLSTQCFIPGDQNTCTIEYHNKRERFCREIFPNGIPREIFFKNRDNYDEILNSSYLIEKEYRDLQPGRDTYLCFINYLVERGLIDVNSYLPLINNYDLPSMMGGHSWANPSSFIKDDLYLLDFAENDTAFFLRLLQKGATKITYEQSCCFPRSNISNIIEKLFKVCKTTEEYFVIKSFIDLKKEYLKEYYTSNGNNLLLLCEYQCLIRLNDVDLFKSFCNKFLNLIISSLCVRNPFTGDVSRSTDSVNHLSEIIVKYISEIIVPLIKEEQNSQRNNNGVWGYNAITGAPITHGQLRDIDSQKWW